MRENAKMAGERSRRGLGLETISRSWDSSEGHLEAPCILSSGVTPASWCDLYLERSPLLFGARGSITAARTSGKPLIVY